MDKNYNGWANYHTWNVALWINNDQPTYKSAVLFAKNELRYGKKPKYDDWLKPSATTPDGVSWTDPYLDHKELDAMFYELTKE